MLSESRALNFLFCLIGFSFQLSVVSASAATVWDREVDVHWSSVPLSQALERLGETQKIGVFLDRRVDPSWTIEFKASLRPVGALLDELADSLGLGCCRFDSVMYIGPKHAAQALATSRTPVPALNRRVPLKIPFLSEPKIVLEVLANNNGMSWRNLNQLPHDLWPQRTLPPMPLFQLFDLLLVGFDVTFELEEDGKTLRIVPLRQPDTVPSTVEPVQDETKPSATALPVPLSRRRFTLTITDQELDGVLRSLTERINLKLEIDEASLAKKNVTLRQRISFEVKNATVGELFRSALSPLKLEFTIRGDTIRVR